MDSIFFNNEPPSSGTQHQQQQQQQLTEKLLLHTNDDNEYNNNINTNSSFPPPSSQQQQQYQAEQERNGLINHHHGTDSSSSSHLFQPVTSTPSFQPSGGGRGNQQQQQQQQQVSPQYRDVWAAIVFVAFQCFIVYYALYGIHNLWYDHHHNNGGGDSNNNNNDKDESLTMLGLTYMILLSTLTALAVTCGMVLLLMKYAHIFLQMTLIMIVFGNIMTVLFCMIHSYWYGIIGSMIFLIYVIICARSYQRRLPFAAANLNVALAAITTNHGLLFIALGISIMINFFYSVICILAYFGSYSKREIDKDDMETHRIMIVFLLAVYYWTTEVGKNVIHVTTAGVMGTFWFAPDDASTFWSPAITDSFYRSVTFSFGSICFGSLVTTILHLLNQWIRDARAMHRRTSIGPSVILCVLECISTFLERIITYFNKWAFVYIGLYGYDYLTAGNKVVTLFAERGWTAIMNDQLVSSVLTLVSTTIGGT